MKVFRPGGLELTQKAAKAIGLCAGQTVLDVGCGVGATLQFLVREYGVYGYGVDLSETAVRCARNGVPAAEVLVADGCTLPYKDAMFDAVFMECTLPLMGSPTAALQEAVRVLKPGGHIVISGLSTKESDAELCSHGRMVEENLRDVFVSQGLKAVLWENESRVLVQFCADAIFQYGSLADYVAAAQQELGGCVLDCRVPVKGTRYLLTAAQKEPSETLV